MHIGSIQPGRVVIYSHGKVKENQFSTTIFNQMHFYRGSN